MSKQSILALFPGQGSQAVGMGKDFFENIPLAQELFKKADELLGFSLSELCFNGPIEKLTITEFVQPAILTVSTICYETFMQKNSADVEIVAAAGHSLGEYSALVAAKALKFEDAVQLVHKRGKFMQEAVPAGLGKMVAILGKSPEEIDSALNQVSIEHKATVQVANYNAIGQIVISGLQESVAEFLEKLGPAKTAELSVSAPFHSQLMAPAAQKLAIELDKIEISKPEFPIYCNVTGTALTNPEEIRSALKQQVCGSVEWVKSMQNAISDYHPEKALEFGSGNVLTNLLKRIDKTQERSSIGAVTDL